MQVTVVTATLNYGRFLPKCLASVFDQVAEGVEIEHLVMDGGSTDGSVALLESWARNHPCTEDYSFRWVSEFDKGLADAINKGLHLATGDVVCWLNADEHFLPGKLKPVVQYFQNHPKTDLVYGEPLFENENGTPIRIRRNHWFSRFVLLYRCCYIPSCAAFWRRPVLDEVGYLDESYKVVMDGEYWDRMASRGCRFAFLPKVISGFVWHGNNVSLRCRDLLESETFRNRLRYSKILMRAPDSVRIRYFKILSPIALLMRRVLIVFRMVLLPMEKVV